MILVMWLPPTSSEISISSNETSMQMLDILQSMMGEMVKKIHPRKQLRIQDFHHWKARAEAVKKYFLSILPNRRESAIPKFDTKVYGNRKNNRFPAQNAPLLVTRYGSIDHADFLFVNNCCVSSFISPLS